MAEETVNADEFLDELSDEGYVGPPAMAAPHELGGIKLAIRSREEDGVKLRETRLDVNDAAMLIVHLQALTTMLFNTMYVQQAQMAQQAQKIHVPGR